MGKASLERKQTHADPGCRIARTQGALRHRDGRAPAARARSGVGLTDVGRGVDLHAAFRDERGLAFRMGANDLAAATVMPGRLGGPKWRLRCDGQEIARSDDPSAAAGFVSWGADGITIRCPDTSIHAYLMEVA